MSQRINLLRVKQYEYITISFLGKKPIEFLFSSIVVGKMKMVEC